jgi:hypothetical protein
MKESLLQGFLAALRFQAGVIGTFLIGGFFGELTQGVALQRVAFLAALGCVGVIVSDLRRDWSGIMAGVTGSFGLSGLILIMLETHTATQWTEVRAWRLALYVTCLGVFFLWSHGRKSASRFRR